MPMTARLSFSPGLGTRANIGAANADAADAARNFRRETRADMIGSREGEGPRDAELPQSVTNRRTNGSGKGAVWEGNALIANRRVPTRHPTRFPQSRVRSS